MLIIPGHNPSFREVRVGTQEGIVEESCSLALLLVYAQLVFLYSAGSLA